MRTITVEEHFATPKFLEGPGHDSVTRAKEAKPGDMAWMLVERLTDLGEGRIAEMDAAGIDVQILSLTAPGVEGLGPDETEAVVREANDYLLCAVQKTPKRFAGFAALPTAVPDKAAQELERKVCQHGFKGAVINGHNRGRYLDHEFYWPLLEAAEALQVPLLIHPTAPPKQVIDAYYSGFAPAVSKASTVPA